MHFENTLDYADWAYRSLIGCKTKNDCFSTYDLIVKEYENFKKEHVIRELDADRLFQFVVSTYVMKRSTMSDRKYR